MSARARLDKLTKNFIPFLVAEHKLVLALVIAGAASLAFVLTADETMEGETQRIDEAVLSALRSPDNLREPIGPSWLLHVAQDISALGGVSIVVLVTLFVCGYFAICRKLRTMVFLMICVGGGTVINMALKEFFARPRPSIVPHLTEVTTSGAFPSGHSMLSAILYLTVAAMLARSTSSPWLRVYYLGLGAFLAGTIGLSRIYLGVHYPTDVLAGWSAGVAFAAFIYAITAWMQRKGSVEKESQNNNNGANEHDNSNRF